VQTVDFFTPVVDDAYAFGQVAAANALSDLYAMGAEPLFALNIVGFPAKKLPLELLGTILRGGADKAREAGIEIVGGHSIDDPEPKYGLVCTGRVRRDAVWTNAAARPGDALVLTKPLASGIFSTALKRQLVAPEREAELVQLMATLNRAAADAARGVQPHACTDVTGFGLFGHLHSMLRASGVQAEIDLERVPFVAEVVELAAAGCVPGGTHANLAHCAPHVAWDGVPEAERLVLCDAQTSGGLLIAVPAHLAPRLVDELQRAATPAHHVIGRIVAATPAEAGRITVRGRLGAGAVEWRR
jgi:selenide,water dikinase